MRLSDFRDERINIVRDGQFELLALSNSHPGKPFLGYLDDPKYLSEIVSNHDLACVLCTKELVQLVETSVSEKIGIATSEKPRYDYFVLHNRLCKEGYTIVPDKPSLLSSDSHISQLAFVDSQNVFIEEGVVVEPFAVITGRCHIGKNSIIRSGARIGCPGYEYKRSDESILEVFHAGSVFIGESVEVKANASIDLAVYSWDQTIIGDYSKLNAGAHVDHGAKIGKRVLLGSNSVVSGRSCIGDDSFVGPGAVVSNRITMGSKTIASIGSVVTKDVGDKYRVSGNFAIPHQAFLSHIKQISNE